MDDRIKIAGTTNGAIGLSAIASFIGLAVSDLGQLRCSACPEPSRWQGWISFALTLVRTSLVATDP